MSGLVIAPPQSPYKGLAPFDDSELDALLFHGRERERDVIIANLMASRLTVLYGDSGVGKSSLLRAGVAQHLRQQARDNLASHGAPELAVAVVSSWTGEPVETVLTTVTGEVDDLVGPGPVEPDASLADALDALSGRLGGDLYVVLDQFEEYFLYHARQNGHGKFALEFPELVNRRGLRINVLIAMREDTLAKLDFFKGRIPGLFANYLRLDQLGRSAARAAILGPIETYNDLAGGERVEIEPELVESVLNEVAAGRVDLGDTGRGGLESTVDETRIEPPYLQLVMERIWRAELERGSRRLRLETLRALGGAEAVVRAHLQTALDALTPAEKDVAAGIFDHLVTPSGTKIAHEVGDLADYAAVDEDALVPVLASLSRERILRPVTAEGDGARYEIFHDVLADPVLAWRAQRRFEAQQQQAERRHRRVLTLAVGALIALAMVAVVAVYALVQRHNAKTSEHRARARALVAESLTQVDVDPQRSVELALRAAALEPTALVERQLRRALVAARLRQTITLGERVVSAVYARDGSLLVAGEHGTIVVAPPGGARKTFHVGRGSVSLAKLDASGRRILVSEGTAAHVVDARTGRRKLTLRHGANVTSASFLPGGRIMTGTFAGSLIVWDAGGKQIRALHMPGPVQRATIAQGGRSLAVVAGDMDGHVRTRLYRANRLVAVLPQIGISDAEFSPKGELLATASRDGSTILWSATNGSRVRTLDDGGGAVTDVAFSPDGSLLATASSDAAIRVWDVRTGQRTFFFVAHAGPATGVTFDPTGIYLLSTSEDRTGRVWQLFGPGMGRQVALLAPHDGVVDAAGFAPDGKTAVTASTDGRARVWDARLEQRLNVVARAKERIAAAAFASGDILDVAGRVLELRRDGNIVRRQTIGPLFALGPRGAVASATGRTITVADVTGRSLRTLRLPSDVAALAFRADGRALVAVGIDGGTAVWNLGSGRPVGRLRVARGTTRAAISPKGDLLATGGQDGAVRIYAGSGRLLAVLRRHPARVTDIRFDASGTRLVSASGNSHDNVLLWDARRRRVLHVLVGHFGDVTAASFSADGRWILTAGPISAGIWPTDTGRLLFYVRGPTDLLTDAEWSPRGYDVITSARDGTVRTYRCDLCRLLDGLVALGRARLAAAR